MKLLTAVVSLLSIPSTNAEGPYWNRISTFPTCLQLDETCNLDNYTAATTVSTTTDGNTAVYSDPFLQTLGFTDITTPSDPSPGGTMSLPGKPTVVAVKDNKYAVVAVVAKDTASSGKMVVVDLMTKEVVKEVDLTGEPDWLALSPDKRYAVISSTVPEAAGAVSIIDISAEDPMAWPANPTMVDMTGLTGLTNPDTPHPGVISINEENRAIVSLPKNNAFVVIDVVSGTVIDSFTQGSVDLTNVDLVDNSIIDQSESKSGVLREADGVAWIGTEYFASANKGATTTGGTRGFTIFSADGSVVWDSGIDVDQILTSVGHYADESSPDFGIALENVLYAADLQELFLNSEGGHVTIVYDVSDPTNPVFKQVLPSGYRPEASTYVEDRKLFITASEFDERGNKVRGSLIIYSYGDEKAQYPTLMSDVDENGLRIPWSALSGMSSDKNSETTLYTINDSAYKKSQIFTIDTSGYAPGLITKAMYVTDPNEVLAAVQPRGNITDEGIDNEFSADDIAAMINDDMTVNIDQEGIVAVADGFWIATEGSGTIDDAKRPIKTLSLLFKTDKNGVIEQVVTLPDEVNDIQLRFGFEGVTTDDDEDHVIVAFQRAWGDESNPRIGIYHTVDGTWKFVYYPLDTRESQLGGWVGLSDISNAGGGNYLVLERDNQGGLDSVIKRIYSINLNNFVEGATLEKTLVMDLADQIKTTGAPLYEKLEGLAYTPEGNVWLSVDNDGVSEVTGETQLWNLGQIYKAPATEIATVIPSPTPPAPVVTTTTATETATTTEAAVETTTSATVAETTTTTKATEPIVTTTEAAVVPPTPPAPTPPSPPAPTPGAPSGAMAVQTTMAAVVVVVAMILL